MAEWNVHGFDRRTAAGLYKGGGINPLVAVFLASRGITGAAEVEYMINPSPANISDPFLMKDMDLAAERIRRAIRDREHVAVYGDYDVDGITSSTLVADYLRSRGLECEIYIPERLEEGYGVRDSALDAIREKGVSLVITVDCGITAAANKRHAAEIGMDMVITDHHEVSGEVPTPPVVNPKQPDCPSPAKMLAGVGVAFKLVCAVDGIERTYELLSKYGDLVAVGTIADVMPMVGENRILIRRGLELLRRGSRPGLKELCFEAGIDPFRVTVTNVGYVIAPRINAAGRLGGTDTAVELLTTGSETRAQILAKDLCSLNAERRRIEDEMLEDALSMLKESPQEGPIVLSGDKWHQGVAGIVASRIADRMGRPAIMICIRNGVGKGSCRSAGSFNIFEALSSCRDILLSFGGHDMAAGITLEEKDVPELRRRLGEEYAKYAPESREEQLEIDFEVMKPGELLTIPNVEALDALEPFGVGNATPVTCMRSVRVRRVTPLSEGKHTKLRVEKDGAEFDALIFGKSPEELGAEQNARADIAFTPKINVFKGRKSVQLNLIDYKPLQ